MENYLQLFVYMSSKKFSNYVFPAHNLLFCIFYVYFKYICQNNDTVYGKCHNVLTNETRPQRQFHIPDQTYFFIRKSLIPFLKSFARHSFCLFKLFLVGAWKVLSTLKVFITWGNAPKLHSLGQEINKLFLKRERVKENL